MKQILVTFIFCLAASHAFAKINKTPSKDNKLKAAVNSAVAKATAGKKVVKVKGMVCAFCAQGVKKKFAKHKAVKETLVDLDTMKVTLVFNKGKSLDDKIIKDVIEAAGFKFVKVL